jgi:hypothetical protein
MNSGVVFAVLLLLHGTVLCADESEWLGAVSQPNSIGIRLGQDNGSGQVTGVNASLAMPYYYQLDLAASRSSGGNSGGNRASDFDYDSYFIAVSSDPYAQWYWQLSYQQAGNDRVLETEDIGLAVGYFPGDWRLELGVIDRQISSYFNPLLQRLGLLDRRSVELQSEGYSFELEYYFDAWSVALASQYIDYPQDLSALQTNRRLQRLLGEQAVTQMYSLTEWQADFSVHYQHSASTRLGGGLIRYKAIVGGELDNTVYVTLDQALTEQFKLIAMLAQSTADKLTYGELALYYSW